LAAANPEDYAIECGPMGPIGEGQALILRVNRNCPWNQCLFCPVYKDKTFSARNVAEIKRDIDAITRTRDLLDRTSWHMGLQGLLRAEVVQETVKRGAQAGPPGRQSAVIAVHVQPRAARTEVVGMHGEALKIRLKAPPVDGAANDELIRFLAARLDVARHDIEITGGAAARTKRVRITGTRLTGEEIVRRLRGVDGS